MICLRTLWSLVPLLFVLVGCGGVSGSPINANKEIRISNSSFDQGLSGGVLAGWQASEHNIGKSYSFTAEGEGAWSSPSSAKIHRFGDELFGLLSQQIPIQPSWVNKTVRLSSHLKGEGIEGAGGALVLQMNSGGGQILAWNHMNDARVLKTQDWKRYFIDLKVVPSTYSIKVGVMLEGGGTLWADDLKLEIID